jgi:hypothetical protein
MLRGRKINYQQKKSIQIKNADASITNEWTVEKQSALPLLAAVDREREWNRVN